VKGRLLFIHLVSAAILLRSLATIFAKTAAIHSLGKGIEGILINVWTWAELVALILQAIVWSHVLNRFSLNRVYPVTSLVFGLNLAAAALIFQEVVQTKHLIGIAIIIIGVIIVNPPGKVGTVTG